MKYYTRKDKRKIEFEVPLCLVYNALLLKIQFELCDANEISYLYIVYYLIRNLQTRNLIKNKHIF